MSDELTERTVTVRVLLRNFEGALISGQQCRIGKHALIVYGDASEKRWARGIVEPGDQEAVMWLPPSEAPTAAAELRRAKGVVDARVEGQPATIPPPTGW